MKIFSKIKNALVSAYVMVTVFLLSNTPAHAEGESGIAVKSASEVSDKLVSLVQNVIQPIGAFVLFAAVSIIAIKLIVKNDKPEERARAMGGLGYVLIGGVLLGGAMMASGFILGLWDGLK